MKKLLSLTAVAAALMAPQWAAAESDVNIAGGSPTSASARLDFRIIIPRVLFLQVGSAANPGLVDNAAIDLIEFSVPAASLGNGTDVAGTGGNLTGGAVDVRVFGNDGNITLAASTTNAAGISNGAETIPWTELLVTAAAGTTGSGFVAAVIPHPTIGSSTTITATNKMIRQHGTWTFAYDNSTTYAAGTYGGVNTNHSRITYTATLP